MLWKVYGPARVWFYLSSVSCPPLAQMSFKCLLRRYFQPILIFKTLFLFDVFSNQNSFTGVEKCQGPKVRCWGERFVCEIVWLWWEELTEELTDWGQAGANKSSVWLRRWRMKCRCWLGRQVNNIFTRFKHRNIAKTDKAGGGRHRGLIHPHVRF